MPAGPYPKWEVPIDGKMVHIDAHSYDTIDGEYVFWETPRKERIVVRLPVDKVGQPLQVEPKLA